MTNKGTDLGVDCSGLWLCARSYFPKVADAFLAGNTNVDGTAAYDGAFTRYGTVPGVNIEANVPGPVQPAWAQARDELQRVMAKTGQNIYATCDALVHVANMYAAADSDAEAHIKFIADVQQYEHNATLQPGDPSYLPIEDPSQRPTAKMPG
jgi:hypothetical protein